MRKRLCLRLSYFLVVVAAAIIVLPASAEAATLSVNSNGDVSADDGVCTLREAILSANADTSSGATPGECAAGSGADTINFAITGPADYTIGGQNGYTIAPATLLPDIAGPITINGYSQAGAQANTAIAPNPLNGRLLIQLDGANQSFGGLRLLAGSSNSQILGLVINRFQGNAIAMKDVTGVRIQGNYVGTDPTGLIGRPNGVNNINSSTAIDIGDATLGTTDTATTNTLIGGLNPADRNIISGNYGGGFGVSCVDTTFYGNYIGLGADGSTSIGNSIGTGVTTGALTIDYADGLIMGGTQVGAANVISANARGIQPDYSTGLQIKGNFIGTDYTGSIARPNLTDGISLGLGTVDSVIGGDTAAEGNIIAYNQYNGVETWTNTSQIPARIVIKNNNIHDNGQDGVNVSNSEDITVQNNSILSNGQNGVIISASVRTLIQGNSLKNNTSAGVWVQIASDNTIGGDTPQERNIISGNLGYANIFLYAAIPFGGATENNVIQGNYIGTNDSGQVDDGITNGVGIAMYGDANNNYIGGDTPSEGNVIAGNVGTGVLIGEFEVPSVYTATPNRNSITGNSILSNKVGDIFGLPFQGIGIDFAHVVLDPNTFLPVSISDQGPTLNDTSDPDTGPNNYMNFPVINSASQTGTALSVNFDLDAADSTDGNYRVEFFANDSEDPSGYGEGQTYLGSTSVTPGSSKTANLTLANGTDLTGKVITATTTAVNNTTTSGFGATSEFSQAHSIEVVAVAGLADTGLNIWMYVMGAIGLMSLGVYVGFQQFRPHLVRIPSSRR